MDWPGNEEMCRRIQAHLDKGGQVVIATYARATRYTAKHREWFSADATGLYVRAGQRRDCINYCGIRFYS